MYADKSQQERDNLGVDMKRAVAASLIVAGLALSGCAEAADDEGDDETSVVEDSESDEDSEDGEDSEDDGGSEESEDE